MTTVELYTKGAKVWIPHKEKVWESAELTEDYLPSKHIIKIQTDETKEKKTIEVKSANDLPFLRNPSILIGENDLTALSYLHEPAVLHNLKVRFCQQKAIYTYCGIVLVAINPYDDLPIYDIDTIQAYKGQTMGDLDPHIFAVAEEAYTKLEREQRDQSIIVSGESGAGKTVSAKYAMRYFATVGGSTTETQVEKKVLASSPIMEAIGNAKTTRNDNSSRFGKFIELQFNQQFHIKGASMRTYLLEKSRVVFQAAEERNYHIFYQLCAGRDRLPDLFLKEQNYFHYLNQGKSPNIDGVDDSKSFDDTINALSLLGFSQNQQTDIFKILAAILHLGNIRFIQTEYSQEEGCDIFDSDKGLLKVAELLSINEEQLSQWLCVKKIVSMRDTILKPMSSEQAFRARDALSKYIYEELFNWIVKIINKSLETDTPRHKFIGVLDIYGFETFDINSFEQFCINYANEKLQQQFNQHVFKLEQEEYLREEIEWKMIDFYDNQPCIDLIETKMGVLSLLDEECKMPKGSDGSWTEKLYLQCIQYKHFSKARFGRTSFMIKHFADLVEYESGGFLEKNRDTVLEEQVSVIKHSKSDFIRKLFCLETETKKTKLKVIHTQPSNVPSKTHKRTVGSQFRDSLNLLMGTLNNTTPHYVRCIKPNDTKSAFKYNPQRAVQQLRACGVLETIRISSAGFPSRWIYLDFFYRYRVLCKSKDISRNNIKLTCEKILQQYITADDMYKFGKTKIFFRAGQVAYLEKLRADKLKRCCIIMQSTIRAFIYKRKYLKIKKAIEGVQRYGRGVLARRLADKIRRNRAAVKIQSRLRGWLKHRKYQKLRNSTISFQAFARGYLARKKFMELKYNAKAIIIQKNVRGWLVRRHKAKLIRKIIICQSAVRRFLARRQFKRLRIEARSIEHVKKLNKGLENKIISLQQKIEELNKQGNELKNVNTEVIELRNKLVMFRALEVEIKNLNNLVIDKNKNINRLEKELKEEKEEKVDLINEKEQHRTETEMQRTLMSEETQKLRSQLNNMNEILQSNKIIEEENLKKRMEEEKIRIINECDVDRQAYQRLLQQYHELELSHDSLQQQLEDKECAHKRNASDLSSTSITDESVHTSNDLTVDHGYSSVRSVSTTRGKLDNIDWHEDIDLKQNDDSIKEEQDIGLVLQLQHKLSATEKEKDQLQKRLDELEMSPRVEKAEIAAQDAIRVSQYEVTISNLRVQLLELTKNLDNGRGQNCLSEQLANLQNELERRNEEIVQLKSILVSQTDNMKSIVNSGIKRGEYINEDGELALAYETQKTINKQLELELQDEKTKYKGYEKEYKSEIERLRKENERLQQLLASNVSNIQQQNDAFIQHELTRITNENLILRNKTDFLRDNVKILKNQNKMLSRKLKENGVECDNNVVVTAESNVPASYNRIPSVRKKEKEYIGMFSFKTNEETVIMKQLVVELKPRTAVSLLPGLPAYIIFMCIRHTDYINDENKVRTLLSAFTNSVKKVIKKRADDFETLALWLSNTLRLVHTMMQYSGDKSFQQQNTSKQNEQSLRNFDLSEYRNLLSDIALWIYQGVIRNLGEKVQPLIVQAILEHEEIQGMGNKLSGFRRRASSLRDVDSPGQKQKPTDALLQELTNNYKILVFYAVDQEVISQIFKQVFYYLCSSSLNNLLLRKELCHWSKGLQIRHNLSHFEMWTREKNLDEQGIQVTLQPIIQAAQLLQARKTDEDVTSICEMCSALTPLQICKILNLYTPVDEFEQRVPLTFINKVQEKLKERPNYVDQQTLLMDTKHSFLARFPFKPSSICLEDIDIPEVLKLPLLEKV